jgi:uncharacterized protein YfaP (DUF2135 family)
VSSRRGGASEAALRFVGGGARRRRLRWWSWPLAVLLVAAACSEPEPPSVAQVVVTGPASMLAGTTASFAAEARDAAGRGIAGRAVAWTSADPAVASIDGAGLVTALAAGGPVRLTATIDGVAGAATTVVHELRISPRQATLEVNEAIALSVAVTDAAGQPAGSPPAPPVWSVSGAAVSISTGGVARGVGPGTARVTASVGTASVSADITVEAVTVVDGPQSPATGTVVVPANVPAATVSVSAGLADRALLGPGGAFQVRTSGTTATLLVAASSDVPFAVRVAPPGGGQGLTIDNMSTAIGLVFLAPFFAGAPPGVMADLLGIIGSVPAVAQLAASIGTAVAATGRLPGPADAAFLAAYRAAVAAAVQEVQRRFPAPGSGSPPAQPMTGSGLRLTWATPTSATVSMDLQNVFGRDVDYYVEPADAAGRPIRDLGALSWGDALLNARPLGTADYVPNVTSLAFWSRVFTGTYGAPPPTRVDVAFTPQSPRVLVYGYGLGFSQFGADFTALAGGERARWVLPALHTATFGMLMPVFELVTGMSLTAAINQNLTGRRLAVLRTTVAVVVGAPPCLRAPSGAVDLLVCIGDILVQQTIDDPAFRRELLRELAEAGGKTLAGASLGAAVKRLNAVLGLVSAATAAAQITQTGYAVLNSRLRQPFDLGYNHLIGAVRITAVQGGGQTGGSGQVLPTPLVVRVTTAGGVPVANAWVGWDASGGGGPSQAMTVTNAAGHAQTGWRLGAAGAQMMTAVLLGTSTQATFTASLQAGGGRISGRVVNGLTNAGIGNASIEFVVGGSRTATTSQSDGTYLSPLLPAGGYDVAVAAAGFVSTTQTGVTVTTGATVAAGTIPLAPSGPGLGGIDGRVVNGQSGSGLAGATVELRLGVNNLAGTPLRSVQSGTGGAFAFAGLNPGTYTLRAATAGFGAGHRAAITVGSATIGNQDVVLVPVSNGTRVVLQWGATPADLDAHLTGPLLAGGRFHVYFSARGSLTVEPFAQLDVDDTNGFGPETITISQVKPGVYRYSVHDYSNRTSTTSTALSASGARVDLYVNGVLTQQFFVPPGPGNLWTVFEMNGGVVTAVNTMSFHSQAGSVPAPPGDVGQAAADHGVIGAAGLRPKAASTTPR